MRRMAFHILSIIVIPLILNINSGLGVSVNLKLKNHIEDSKWQPDSKVENETTNYFPILNITKSPDPSSSVSGPTLVPYNLVTESLDVGNNSSRAFDLSNSSEISNTVSNTSEIILVIQSKLSHETNNFMNESEDAEEIVETVPKNGEDYRNLTPDNNLTAEDVYLVISISSPFDVNLPHQKQPNGTAKSWTYEMFDLRNMDSISFIGGAATVFVLALMVALFLKLCKK